MIIMPPTIPSNPAMCSLCPRPKKPQKKLVRFDSVVDTFSISDSNGPRRVSKFFQFILIKNFSVFFSILAFVYLKNFFFFNDLFN